MSDEETTQPPRQPNTFRMWLPRIWKFLVAGIAANPDIALIVFISILGIVAIWAVL